MNNLSIMNFAILNNKVRRGDSPPLILSYLILSYLILSYLICSNKNSFYSFSMCKTQGEDIR